MNQQNAAKTEEQELVAKVNLDNFILLIFSTSNKLKLFIEIQHNSENLNVGEESENCAKDTINTKVSRQQLIELLSPHCSPDLLNISTIDDIAARMSKGESVSRRRIAKGTEPIAGRNGKIVFLVKQFNQNCFNEKTEIVDLRFRRLFDNVREGNTVARVYLPKHGTAGTDVFGKEIPAPEGSEIKPKFNKSLSLVESNQKYSTLQANLSGYLTEISGTLQISDQLLIKQNIDYLTGDIDFVGYLEIRGEVHSGFQVRGGKGLKITGDVYGGKLKSEYGAIEVTGAIYGYSSEDHLNSKKQLEEALNMGADLPLQVQANGPLKARILLGIRAEILSDINVSKEIQRCILRAGGEINGKTAHIYGGRLESAKAIQASILGAEAAPKTLLNLANQTQQTPEYIELDTKIQKLSLAESSLLSYLGPYAKNPARIKLLKGQHKTKLEDLHQKLLQVNTLLKTLKAERDELLAKHPDNEPPPTVTFHKKMYPGVTIKYLEHEFQSMEAVKGPKTVKYTPDKNSLCLS